MYPKNWAAEGVSYTALLTSLIQLAFEISDRKKAIRAHYDLFVTQKREEHGAL